MVESKFVWGDEVGRNVTTSLPFHVKLDVLNEHDEPMSDYAEIITISAVTTTICLREGFEDRQLGLWCVLRLGSRPHPPAFTPLAALPPAGRRPSCLVTTSTALTARCALLARRAACSSRAATTPTLG